MKKIILLTALVFLGISMKNVETISIFNVDNYGLIATSDLFIDLSSDKELPVNYTARDSASFTVGQVEYTLKIGNRWPIHDSPGDYDIIQFYKNQQELFSIEEVDMLLKYHDSRREDSHIQTFSNFADNPYFININLSDTSNALIFMGPLYSVSPSAMLIFVFTENDAKLVLNKELELISMISTDTKFEMKVESVSKQLISMNPDTWSEPVTHTIWLEDGVLKFKDN